MKKRKLRPNIVLIMADQLAPQFLPCYGHPVVKAPTIQKLAEEGVVFDAAYTNSPLCAPARFVMMSGRLPSKIAAWDNAAEFSSEVPTLAHYLAAEGYHTCLSGKMHFVGPDQLHGFEMRLTTDVYPADFTWHPEWDRPDERLDWYHTMEVVSKAGPCLRSMYLDYDDEALFHAKRYIFERARDHADKPFMLTLSMIQPHDPYLCRPEKWDLYREDEIDLPRVPLGAVAEDPHSTRLRYAYGASDLDLDDETIRRARRAYYGSIADIDDKVAKILHALHEAGLADNTIIILTSDHGDMLGERGLWFKMSFFEHSARVPLIIHAPKLFSPRRVRQAVSLVDLLPTVVEMVRDGEAPDFATPLEGRSLLPHVTSGSGHDEVFGEYYAEATASPIFMIRRANTKFIYSEADPPLLYDLADDPHEVRNRAADPGGAAEVESLVQELRQRHDCAALKAAVLESQRRRKLLKRVMRDQGLSWDYRPEQDAAHAYVRNTLPIYELEKRARFPSV
ncbi:MAG TPA: choline-sulfatase [Alphaproteobacteria bacterium]|nr:choline-sulfatase [Alphaproteobacteria bacterium]